MTQLNKAQMALFKHSNSVRCSECKEVIAYTILPVETGTICRKCLIDMVGDKK